MQRPLFPRINRRASLGGGLLFAALGGGASTSMCGDSSGFGNNCAMTAVDHTNWAIDPYLSRRKVTYDGSAEYVDLGTVTRSWFLGLPSFAFSSWVRTTQTERASLLGSYNSLTAPFYSVEINRGASIPDSGKLFIISRRTTTLTDLTGYSTADTMINDGNWHHLSVNVGLLANTISVFLDGVAVPITYVAQDYGAVGVTTVRNLFLAGLNNAGSLAVPFAGSLSDVLIHGRAITLPEIQILTKPDPWLGGLILQPTRKLWPVAVGGAPAGISASAVCTGTNATVSANATVRVAASAVATGTSGTVAAAATVTIAATSACVGGNATTTAAAKVAISASAVCAGANAVVVARIGEAPAETYKPMMFMVC